jgi:hypothetical protein
MIYLRPAKTTQARLLDHDAIARPRDSQAKKEKNGELSQGRYISLCLILFWMRRADVM